MFSDINFKLNLMSCLCIWDKESRSQLYSGGRLLLLQPLFNSHLKKKKRKSGEINREHSFHINGQGEQI